MRKRTLPTKVAGALRGRSGGFTLIEVLVALALFGIIAITFVGGLGTASRAALTGDIRATAESLARSQMEYVKNQDYYAWDWSYKVDHKGSECECDLQKDEKCPGCTPKYELESEYTGYRAEIEAEELEEGLQQITVSVFHDSRDTRVIQLEGYKTDR